MDVLTDILTTLKLSGTVYFQAEFRAPWGMDIKGGSVASFHLIVDGGCWLRHPVSDEMIELDKGDLVVLPHGHRHALLDSPEAQPHPAESVMQSGKTEGSRLVYGGGGQASTIICGHYEYDRSGGHPVLAALPPLILLSQAQQGEWLETASRLTVMESNSQEPGANAIVNRLSEVLLIQVIRKYAERLENKEGFFAALSDTAVCRVLTLIHQYPERDWRLDAMARESCVSKTLLVDKFNQTLGMAPIQYLTEWRMHKAREILRDSEFSIADVAEQVGYSSEWSFSKAFKRVFNKGPGAMRRKAT